MERAMPYQVRPDVPLSIAVKTVRRCLAIQHCSMFVKTDFQRQHSVYFDDDFDMCGDWDWICRLWAAEPMVSVVNKDFGVWRQHSEQKSEKMASVGRSEAIRVLSSQNVSHRSHQILKYLYSAYSKASHGMALAATHGAMAPFKRRR